jgi:CheY-like chemotaxis protein
MPGRYRFLVVDDNVDGADSQAVLLRILGHQVWTAYDGASALTKAEEFRPQIVLLDLGMPGMNGFEVVRRLRALPGLGTIVVIAQTGWGQAEDREKTIEAGFDAHLTKPVEASSLLELLEKYRARLESPSND